MQTTKLDMVCEARQKILLLGSGEGKSVAPRTSGARENPTERAPFSLCTEDAFRKECGVPTVHEATLFVDHAA
jgi:hypothetical protein